jgi:hypothetical protein
MLKNEASRPLLNASAFTIRSSPPEADQKVKAKVIIDGKSFINENEIPIVNYELNNNRVFKHLISFLQA